MENVGCTRLTDCAQANGIIIGAFKGGGGPRPGSDSEYDLTSRNLLFFAFGSAYLGAFQYGTSQHLQAHLHGHRKIPSQSLEKKLKDTGG